MMRAQISTCAFLVAGLSLAFCACSSSNNNDAGPDTGPFFDAGFGQDTGPNGDDGGADGSVTDATGDDAAADSGPADAGADAGGMDATITDMGPLDAGGCLGNQIVDLNSAGSRNGNVVQIDGTNAAVTSPMSVKMPSCAGTVSNEVVFAYRPNQATKLVVSSDYSSTAVATVVWALDRCPTDSASLSLGCSTFAGVGPMPMASLFVTNVVPASQPVYIVLAGNNMASGAYTLSVSELPQLNVGDECDSSGLTNYCPTGSACQPSGNKNICIGDGTQGGNCRMTAPNCDANLACNAMPSQPGALCVPAVAVGGNCDPTGYYNRCASPGQCLPGASGSSLPNESGMCVASPYSETGVAPTFINACSPGTHVNLVSSEISGTNPRDDGRSPAAINLPANFNFSFFGDLQTQFWPTTNGYLFFGSAKPSSDTAPSSTILGTMNSLGAFIAPLAEDLVLGTSPASDVCYFTTATTPRQFVVQWLATQSKIAKTPTATALTFEVILTEGTNAIDFVYKTLSANSEDSSFIDGSRASVGFQSAAGEKFVIHPGPIATGVGLHFTPN